MRAGRGTEPGIRAVFGGPVALAVAFLAIHVVLACINLFDTGLNSMGDVTAVYRYWIDFWHTNGVLVGVNTNWVYPIGALPPMLLASVLGDQVYGATWILLVTILDGVALILLARVSSRAAWWWLLVTACLGPVSIVRIDSIALPFAIVGALLVVRRPGVATAIFTVAAWIKVWPAAFVAAMLLAARHRAPVIAAAAGASAVIIAAAIVAGARSEIFSFISAQTGRGLQIEAPISALWLWDGVWHVGGAGVYFDTNILTWQLKGEGVAATAAVMSYVLLAGVVAVCVLGLLAVRRGADRATTIALIALGLVTASIALNKVGSPQYFTWFVAPIVLGIIVAPGRFRAPAIMVVVLDVLTQIIYPWGYLRLLDLDPLFIVVLDVRDLLEFVLFGWVLQALLTVPRASVLPSVVREVPRPTPRMEAASRKEAKAASLRLDR